MEFWEDCDTQESGCHLHGEVCEGVVVYLIRVGEQSIQNQIV